MRRRRTLAGLSLGLAAASPCLASGALPRIEIPIAQTRLSDGNIRYSVPVSIEGAPPVAAMLDTGSAGLRILAGLLTVWTRRRVVKLKTEAIRALRLDLLQRLYEQPYLSHVHGRTRPFTAHIVADCERIDAMTDSILGSALTAALTGLVLGIALLCLNAAMTLAGLALAPLLWLAGRFATRRMQGNFFASSYFFAPDIHGHIDLLLL